MSNVAAPKRRFNLDERGEQFGGCDESLVALDQLVPWEQFRPALAQALNRERRRVAEYVRFDSVLLFKAVVLKELYGLTDADAACQIADRLSFQRFVGLPAGHPSEKLDTRAFRRCLSSFAGILRWQGLVRPLLDRFHAFLDEAGVRIQKGQIRDIAMVACLTKASEHQRGCV